MMHFLVVFDTFGTHFEFVEQEWSFQKQRFQLNGVLLMFC